MMRAFLSIACLTVLASCASHSAPKAEHPVASGPSYERLVRTARMDTDAGRINEAVPLLEQAVALDPERPEAYQVWGLALARRGELEESAKKYEAAKDHGATNRRLFVELASVYDVSQRYEDAVRVYRQYLELHPEDAEMRQELGLTLLLLNRAQEAVESLQRAQELAPDNVQLQQDLGYALLRAGDNERAANLFEKIIELEPQRHEALLFLARAQAARGELGRAITVLDRALAERPDDARALRMRAHLALVTGDAAAAAADYEKLRKLVPSDDAAVWLGLVGALIAQGKVRRAAETIEQARERIGTHPVLEFRQAQVDWRMGDKEAVLRIVHYARENPNNVEAWRDVLAAAKKTRNPKLRREAQKRLHTLGDLP